MKNFKNLSMISAVALSLVAGAAHANLETGTNTWNLATPTAPKFCAITQPTINAQLTYNLTSNTWTLVTPGEVRFEMNGATTVEFVTTGILTVNGVQHPTPVPSISTGWTSTGGHVATKADGTTQNLVPNSFNSASKPASMISNNGTRFTIPATTVEFVAKPGGTVTPPADLGLRDGDVATVSWTVTCIG